MSQQKTDDFILLSEPEKFHSSIIHTAGETGFQPHLIEKDYYCTQILKLLSIEKNVSLIFKGGTLLAKGYAGFYRLSEDLDFTIPVSNSANRKQRSKLAKPLKSLISNIPNMLDVFMLEKELTGSNESRQYNAELRYPSCINKSSGRILIEIGLREELLTSPMNAELKTLLLDPFTNIDFEAPIQFQCLSKYETYAEKMRAALCREKLAIRDFYDIGYAIKSHVINLDEPKFVKLVKDKINLTDTKIIDFDDHRMQLLTEKIDSELFPTLNPKNKFQFNLNQVIELLNAFRKKHFSMQCVE